MKRSLFVPIVLLAGLCVLAATASPQAPKKAGIVGTWVGTAIVSDDGTGMEITVVVGKAESGYTGKLSDASGAIHGGRAEGHRLQGQQVHLRVRPARGHGRHADHDRAHPRGRDAQGGVVRSRRQLGGDRALAEEIARPSDPGPACAEGLGLGPPHVV